MGNVPKVDPRQLAAEIEDAAREFNRLAMLAATVGVGVEAEVHIQKMVGLVDRPVLMVRVAKS